MSPVTAFRWTLHSVVVAVGFAVAGCAHQSLGDVDRHAEDLASRTLIVDTHIDVPYRLHRHPEDVGRATERGEFDYPRAREGGLDVAFMSIYVPAAVDVAGNARTLADTLIDDMHALAAEQPQRFALATCSADVEVLHGSERVALALGMENGAPIAGDLANLDHYRARGIRYITLTHSHANHLADSSYDDEVRWSGLSPFGETLVVAMNRRGVMVDVSHVSDAAFHDVMNIAEAPVIASHSSLRHFTPGFERNLSDDMVRAIGANGGVVHITFGSAFLTAEANAFDPRDGAGRAYPYAGVDVVIDHVDRAVALAGIDHVGLGSDFEGVGDTLPIGLKDVSDYPNLIAGLVRRGYADDEIEKILGGNLMRVWRQVESYGEANGYPPLCAQADAQPDS